MWREKNTQTQRHRNIDKQTKTHKFRFWALNVACELRKGRTGLNTDFKLKNAVSSTQKHIKQDSTTHSNTSKKHLAHQNL